MALLVARHSVDSEILVLIVFPTGIMEGAPIGAGTDKDLARVANFNINNIDKGLDNLLSWLANAEPDVVSLQELKAEQGAFPMNALRTLGYEAVCARSE